MSDSELTPSDPSPQRESPKGAHAPSDTPVQDHHTAAGQAPDGQPPRDPELPADEETARMAKNDALPNEDRADIA
jgi:hypothetical protein